jgi:hypothetical protein
MTDQEREDAAMKHVAAIMAATRRFSEMGDLALAVEVLGLSAAIRETVSKNPQITALLTCAAYRICPALAKKGGAA